MISAVKSFERVKVFCCFLFSVGLCSRGLEERKGKRSDQGETCPLKVSNTRDIALSVGQTRTPDIPSCCTDICRQQEDIGELSPDIKKKHRSIFLVYVQP